MVQNRPAIPAPMKRAIRQRDGYGCVVCGFLIYDLEHYVSHSEIREHSEENIYLLCPNHHREKTSGLLPLSIIEEARKKPFNIKRQKTSAKKLYYKGSECEVFIGGNKYITSLSQEHDECIILRADNEDLLKLRLEDNNLLLTLKIYNENHSVVLQIIDNELIINTENWDVELVGNVLTIRKAPREIIIEVTFNPPSIVHINKGLFYSKLGIPIRVSDQGQVIGDPNGRFSSFTNCTFRNFICCISVNSDDFQMRTAS